MNIVLDDGFSFGLGVFETICLKEGRALLLDWHLERINNSLEYFNIYQRISKKEVEKWLEENKEDISKDSSGKKAFKIMASASNKIFLLRDNPYDKEKTDRGFNLEYSNVLRNESSSLVYHKSFNYGDNILEKRRLKNTATDEVIFLNSKGQISEGSTTNIFFVRDKKIYTPQKECGLLPGILRRFIIEKFDVKEEKLYPKDVYDMEECFVTNSLMGIMPVNKLADKYFERGEIIRKCQNIYQSYME
ncbi:4-amino-4-deoxychorismate lyase [Acetitomaculum ruminis DSM 5522]|uniref:4-amino-4-deoxychorismate lyase n=1 Tax=Acetitomaculum ruminis DSM 5522 TaxID=1120918 RepID=A0A1I0ZM11_9FIRM|nr:aminotransferase class IV [Acetitomaculum ruminis]SFB26402.1 4-amino-4-deoxychorismate lyase [Acetitomaculum ruminis DSM 5522]